MPSPSTALQIIEDALALTNAVGVDQTLGARTTADGLRALNDLLEDWSTQHLAVYGQANQTFTTVPWQGTYTIGIGGDWVSPRPVRIQGGYATYNGASLPLWPLTQPDYDAIAVKAQAQEYPSAYLYVNDAPLGLITLWPTPSAAAPVTFAIDRVLAQVPTAATVLSFPPGYVNAFVHALGVKLGPTFGKQMRNYPTVMAEAARSFGNIKRANKTIPRAQYDVSLLVGRWR